MNKRNWIELSRKLVDRYDMKYTSDNYQKILGEYANGFWGVGVLPTTFYPNPFPITMSGAVRGGSVGNGIAFDETGLLIRIDTSSTTSKNFLVAANAGATRYDLLVIRFKETGDTPIPKPSDPILTVDLNLIDDFELIVRQGTTAGYPTKTAGDVILCGLQVPNGATLGTQITVDLGVRELCRVNYTEQAVFVQEVPTGTVDGTNKDFTLSQTPYDSNSLIMILNNRVLLKTEYALNGQIVTFVDAPALAQSVAAFYVANSPTSINPVSGLQEVPTGTINGINDTFNLAGKPFDVNSLLVFVDRFLVPPTEYTLVQGSPTYKIKFNAGSIPAPGQDLYVFYFQNAAPGGGGGSGANVSLSNLVSPQLNTNIDVNGKFFNNVPTPTAPGHVANRAYVDAAIGGSLLAVGSPGTPETVVPATGIVLSAVKRQAHWVKSQGGQQTVTANPQIAAGVSEGDELILFGTSDVDYPSLNDGNGLALNGTLDLKQNASTYLVWDGIVWNEISRR